jgi:hypothetical protein
MTHRRKRFIVYPPNYNPHSAENQRLKKHYSKHKAIKAAWKLGDGAEIMEFITIVEQRTLTDISGREWVIYKTKKFTRGMINE